MPTVDAPFPDRSELGEMPWWNAGRARLVYVDINAGLVHELDPSTGELATVALTDPISFAAPVGDSDLLLCGNGNDLIAIDPSGAEQGRLAIEPDMVGNRLNEGKADPRGRLWMGSMSKTREPDQAGFYRFDTAGLTRISTITIGNGTDWDVARGRMYHVDSITQKVDAWDYDVATGEVENRRTWATIEPDDGLPDGLTIDAEGCVWLCLFGGGVVRRFDPDGGVMLDVELPTKYATCPAFGGHDLSTLFVTTSRHKIPPEQRAGDPLAGALLVIDAGVSGRPGNTVALEVGQLVVA